jgi:uncharacterized protein YecE (DUF72 family)
VTRIRVGISGWTYAGWRGVFYPEKLAHRRELEYASRKLSTIEINGSFYSLQTPSSYRRWYQETPEDFVFAVKGGRFITHMKKLREVETPVANFFASGVLALEEKLGPVLWQFPAQLAYTRDRFEPFLELLPRTTGEAAALAARHDERLEGRSCTDCSRDAPLRHAFEVRHPSFFVPSFIELLRRHNAALVLADTAGLWPYAEDFTADFVYLRLHGAEALYSSGYTDGQLDWWASRIRLWRAGEHPDDATLAAPHSAATGERDVYVYFDNDAKVHAPFDAIRLAERLA